MLTPLGAGLGLAVGSSAALNASYLVQHAATRGAAALDARHPLRSVRVLFGSRSWQAGLALGLAGWALYVGALAKAPLSLVQAFAAGGLALVVPAGARFLGERLTRGERLAIGAMVASLALLGTGAVGTAPRAVPAAALAGLLGASAVGAAVAAALVRGRTRARVLGGAGGVLYGAADAATKAVAIVAHGGLAAALVGPWAASVVLATVAAFACFQRGLQIGPAVPVIALMTAATNATAILGGLVAFGDPLGATVPLAALHAGALAVAGASSLGLAAAQARLAADSGRSSGRGRPGRRGGRAGRGQGRPSWAPASRSATGAARRHSPQSWPPG